MFTRVTPAGRSMSVVLERSGAVFLHVPKTGGSWVRAALDASGVPWREEGDKHLDHQATRSLSPGAPRFTVVRNPYEWYQSHWAMSRTRPCDFFPSSVVVSSDFLSFVRLACRHYPGFLTSWYNRFAVPGVLILRNENLRNDLAAALRSLGEPFDEVLLANTPAANVIGRQESWAARVLYTRDIAATLYRSEEPSFVRFQYPRNSITKYAAPHYRKRVAPRKPSRGNAKVKNNTKQHFGNWGWGLRRKAH